MLIRLQKKKQIIDELSLLSNKRHIYIGLLLFGFCIACKNQIVKTYPNYLPECKTITVKEFLETTVLNENCYNIKGYISAMQVCPPCPKGANCKPCPPDGIYITDQFQKNHNYKNSLKLMVEFKKTNQFKIGDYGIYSFLASDKNIKTDKGKMLYNYRLLGYNKHNQ